MLLEQLMADEIRRRQPRNVAQAKSFRELLEKTLQRYHNRLIDAATVVAEMLRMKQEMDASDARARELGLAEEEVAFYDAIADNAARVYDETFLRDLVHDVVQTIKRNLKVDWTEPHRDQVRAEIRAAVKRVLRKRGVREADFEPFIARFIQQAEAQYASGRWSHSGQLAAGVARWHLTTTPQTESRSNATSTHSHPFSIRAITCASIGSLNLCVA
jgi:type I restriction enzyme R subunit